MSGVQLGFLVTLAGTTLRMPPKISASRVAIVVPVYNAERRLHESIETIRNFVHEKIQWACELVIVENGSTDRRISLPSKYKSNFLTSESYTDRPRGRGGATWNQAPAEALSYVDVDVSTDLEALRAILSAILDEN